MIFKHSTKYFISAFVFVLVVPISLLVAFNVIVDPYWYFDIVKIPILNKHKPQFVSNARMAKSQHICKQRPSNIILGNSRSELGLSTTHHLWKNYPGTTYNMGLAGSGIWEINKSLQHAYYGSGKLKTAIITVDFIMFNRFLEDIVFKTLVNGFDINRLMLSPKDSRLRVLRYDLNNLLGYDAAIDSYQTILKNLKLKPSTHIDYRRDGRMLFTFEDKEQSAKYDHNNHSSEEYIYDPEIPYDQQYGQEIAFVNKTWRAGGYKRYCFCDSNGKNSTLDEFENMLRFAREKKLDLKLMISPEHATMLIALQEAGLWVMYEDWKRQLVEINEKVAQEFLVDPYKIYDFSGFNHITTVLRQDLHTKYYWEASHYTDYVGDLMLDVMLNKDNAPINYGFGTILTRNNIESHLDATLLHSKEFAKKDYIKHLKDAISLQFVNGEGSTCGYHNELLYKVNDETDPVISQQLLTQAFNVYTAEESRYRNREVPYRESGFLSMLALISNGKHIERPLDSWQKYQERGALKLQNKEYVSAIEDFSKAILDSPPNTVLYYQRGNAYLHSFQYDKAVNDFEIALKLEPENESLQKLCNEAKNMLGLKI